MAARLAGELPERLGVPASTLSRHIPFLASIGLVRQERELRVLRCKPNDALIDAIISLAGASLPAAEAQVSEPRNTIRSSAWSHLKPTASIDAPAGIGGGYLMRGSPKVVPRLDARE